MHHVAANDADGSCCSGLARAASQSFRLTMQPIPAGVLRGSPPFVEQVCLFVDNLAGVRAATEQLSPDGVGGDVWCVLSADGFRLEWMHEPTLKKYEQDFKLDGTPLGERRPWVRRARLHSV